MAEKLLNDKIEKKKDSIKVVDKGDFKAKKGTFEAVKEAADFAARKKLMNYARK